MPIVMSAGPSGDGAIENIDIARHQLIGIVAFAFCQRADLVVAQKRQRYFVELQIAASGGVKLGDLLFEDCDQVVPVFFDIGIDFGVDGFLELAEVHVRRRRHGDFDRIFAPRTR